MKIAYFSAEPWEKEYVAKRLPKNDVLFYDGHVNANPEVSEPDAEALSVFVDSKIGEPQLARFPKLKWVATRSTGFDHIDLAACAKRGIGVANVPSYGENTVAEFAFALILALSRRIIEAHDLISRTGTFTQEHLRGFDLAGKTLGVVGCGHIGVNAIRIGNGFGMKVLGFDVRQDAALAQKLGFSYAGLDELLASSDIITLHVPYNAHTRHLLNRDNMKKIKRGATLINTSRGGIVETEALIGALKDGTISCAGLDVLEEEGEMSETEELALLTAKHPNESALKAVLADRYLIDHPCVIVTPHIAFDTDEAVKRIVDTTLENLKAFIAGTPVNLVKLND